MGMAVSDSNRCIICINNICEKIGSFLYPSQYANLNRIIEKINCLKIFTSIHFNKKKWYLKHLKKIYLFV